MQAEDLAVPVGVDTGRHQGVDTDDPATLTHLQHKSVGGHERERAGVIETPGAELFHVRVELLGHLADLRLRQCRDAQRLHQLVHLPGADPEQVAGRHHAGQRPLGALASL